MLKVSEVGLAGSRKIPVQKKQMVSFREVGAGVMPKMGFQIQKHNPVSKTDTFVPVQTNKPTSRAKGIIDIIPDSYIDDIIAGLIVAGAAIFTRGKIKNNAGDGGLMENVVDAAKKVAREEAQKVLNKGTQEAPKAVDVATTIADEINKAKPGIVEEAQKGARDAVSMAENIAGKVSSTVKGFFSKVVDVNGHKYNVAAIDGVKLSPQNMANLETKLHAEAAKQILGLGNKKIATIPQKGNIAIVTAEYNGLASTGGLGAVPKEIIQNLTRMFAIGDQDIRATLYMPLYTGKIDPANYRKLEQAEDGSFLYKNIKGGVESVVARLKKVFTMDTPIYAESKTTQSVDVLKGETLIDLPGTTDKHIQKAVDLFKNSINNLTAGAEKKVNVTDTLRAELAKINSDFSQFDSITFTKTKNGLSAFGNILGEAKPQDITSSVEKLVDVSANDVSATINGLALGKSFDAGNIRFTKGKNGVDAKGIMDIILLDNEKFKLNVNGTDPNKIYNRSINSDEVERFIYFDKYIYELFANDKKPQSVTIPDALVGNDWHTGGLSALLKTLTPVNEAFNEIDSKTAEKLYNMPQISLMHNAQYGGQIWDNQDALLNVLFGNKAEIILKNSYLNLTAPSHLEGTKLAADHWHGMLHGTNPGISLQKMLVTYSDILIPVSKGYADELAMKEVYAAGKLPIYAARAKMGEYAKPEVLKEIARINNINIPEGVDLSQRTLIGITNGCDGENNTLTDKIIKIIGANTNIGEAKLTPYQKGENALEWHQKQKKIALDVLKDSVAYGKEGLNNNPKRSFNIVNPQDVNLDGVTENTPIFVSSGRIVDQKGLDIFSDSLVEFYTKNQDIAEPPVFFLQGQGDKALIDKFLQAKEKVKLLNKKAAERMLFADLFDLPRYHLTKLLSDFSVMPSWFEPCGLSHKEIGKFSGALTVVNRTGGLVDGLTEGVNVIVSDFVPRKAQPATAEEVAKNASNFAAAIKKAVNLYNDKEKFGKGVESMINTNFDWASEGGPIYKYTDLFEQMGVLSHATATAKIK